MVRSLAATLILLVTMAAATAVAGEWSNFQGEIEALIKPLRGLNQVSRREAKLTMEAFRNNVTALFDSTRPRNDPGDHSTEGLRTALLGAMFALERHTGDKKEATRWAAEELVRGLYEARGDRPVLLRARERLFDKDAAGQLAPGDLRRLRSIQGKLVLESMSASLAARDNVWALLNARPPLVHLAGRWAKIRSFISRAGASAPRTTGADGPRSRIR